VNVTTKTCSGFATGDARSGVQDQLGGRVEQGRRSPWLERGAGQRPDLRDRSAVDKHLERRLTVELHERHAGVAPVGLLLADELVEPADHVGGHRLHRPRPVQQKVDVRVHRRQLLSSGHRERGSRRV